MAPFRLKDVLLTWGRIVPATIRTALRGQRPVIRSDGTCIRDYFDVKDGAARRDCFVRLALRGGTRR
jgi:hypothetical protein